MEYNFTTIHTHQHGGTVSVDLEEGYGYWEYPSGAEGGGLWFQEYDGIQTLTDFDGHGTLPRRVIDALRAHGINVPADFE